MDHNMDFGINLAQNTMSSSEKREKNIQPGNGSEMRNATQNFLEAEMGSNFAFQPSNNTQNTPMDNILNNDANKFQSDEISNQNNPFSDHRDDDEFEHDSLNFSPTLPKSTVENENVKFISSTDLLDDFDTAKNSMFKTGEDMEKKFNQFITDGKNEIIGNLGNPVNLEFKVEPDNVKLISSDNLLDDFEVTKPIIKPLVPESQQMHSKVDEIKNLGTVTESQNQLDFNIEPSKTKTTDILLDNFGISSNPAQKPTAPEPERKQFSAYDDEFFKSSENFAPQKDTNISHKFISNENFGVDDIRTLPTNISKNIDNIKEKITKPFTTPSSTSKVLKTEPLKTNIMQGEVIFHKPSGSGKSNFNLHPLLESLIYWRDVKLSGAVFGIGLIILIALSFFSVISVIAYSSLIVLTGTIGFRIYKYVLGVINDAQEGHPFEKYLHSDIDISQDRVRQFCGVSVANLNAFASELKKLFLVEDYVETFKFGIIMWILTYIGSWFNGMTLIILAYILLFTMPKLYEQNKQIIDQNMEFARTKVLEISEKIYAVIPFGKNTTIEADKNK